MLWKRASSESHLGFDEENLPVVRRIWIDGFINDEFIGIHTHHPDAAVKSLSREHHEEIIQWKIVMKKRDKPRPDNFVTARNA